VAGLSVCLLAPGALAQTSKDELAKKSLNPVASLISVPLKLDHDSDIGPAEQGSKTVLTVQPVVPVSIATDWNMISRTLVPIVSQSDVAPGAGTQSGLGDITQQRYFSPKAPTAGGWIWGAGPQFLLPTGASELTADKWGLGVTAVLLRQAKGWTYGALVNHMSSVAGEDDRDDISATYLQPFLSYTTSSFTTYGINTESVYNWKSETWAVPINATVTQLLKIGEQPLTLQAGARYWADSPDSLGPKGWGFRLQLTFLFPK
jgi:hypothetical protein